MRTDRPTLARCADRNRNPQGSVRCFVLGRAQSSVHCRAASKLDGDAGNSVDPLWLRSPIFNFLTSIFMHFPLQPDWSIPLCTPSPSRPRAVHQMISPVSLRPDALESRIIYKVLAFWLAGMGQSYYYLSSGRVCLRRIKLRFLPYFSSPVLLPVLSSRRRNGFL
jgi:hypothetical protein